MMNEKKKELDYFIYEKINQVPEKIFQDKDFLEMVLHAEIVVFTRGMEFDDKMSLFSHYADCKDSKNVARFFVNDNL